MTISIIPPSELILAELGINSPYLSELPLNKLDHYIAVINWLTDYKPRPDDSNLEKVLGYLEAFHHLCEVEAWEQASKILFIRLNTPTSEVLHKQLNIWGYYREQTNLYSRLLDKLSPSLNAIFL